MYRFNLLEWGTVTSWRTNKRLCRANIAFLKACSMLNLNPDLDTKLMTQQDPELRTFRVHDIAYQ